MRTLERNKSNIWYALYQSTERVKDEYGNETGEGKVLYSTPQLIRANVSAATGAAQMEQFGNLESYDKVIVTDDLSCPITETSVLFVDKEPEYSSDGTLQYDYIVRRVARSLNSISYAIRKVNVS